MRTEHKKVTSQQRQRDRHTQTERELDKKIDSQREKIKEREVYLVFHISLVALTVI